VGKDEEAHMVSLTTVEAQLKKIGCNFRYWGRAELKELCHVLLDGETIASCINGQYEGGFALLCATDTRVLLVDKKPRFLTLKDIRFEMITEMDYSHRLLNATIRLFTPNKELRFTAMNQRRLRQLFHYVQHRVVETRQQFMSQQFRQPALAAALGTLGGDDSSFAGLGQPQAPTFIPNQATTTATASPVGSSPRIASLMGAIGLRGGDNSKDESAPSITARYASSAGFHNWRRRIAPYRY
jgi:hypothetical protein